MNEYARPRPPLRSSSGPSLMADHAQSHRRIFLGPMPYHVRDDGHDDAEAAEFVSQHGLRIFLQQGGRLEEWTEAKAKEYKERLKERILESAAWHAVTGSSKKGKKKGMMPTVEWRGDTFEIGKVAGVSVNMLATPEESMQDIRQRSERSFPTSKSAATVHWDEPARTSFFTARSTLSGAGSPSTSSPQLQPSQTAPVGQRVSDISEETNGEANERNESTSSRTPLVSEVASQSTPRGDFARASRLRGAKSEGDLPKQGKPGLKSILSGPGKDKGKGKAVRYAEAPRKRTPSRSQTPALPEEVLGRSPTAVDPSVAAVAEAVASELNDGGDDDSNPVVSRDRMLVSVWRCEHESLKSPFTEQESRITRGRDSKEWDEFLVIWRKHRIELYESYHTPCKERILGHKHLAFVIPLTSPRTKLSVFSPVDMTFCLICPPTPTKSKGTRGRRWIFYRSPRGLNVFVFKHKSRSRALDWIWNLWMNLGGALPEHIEVGCPLVHVRISLPIPDSGLGWKEFTRDFVIDQCSRAMGGSFAWQTIIQLPILNGRRLELCWRSDSKLDWVWLKGDVDGRKRDWEVLFGLAMNYLGDPIHLELHLASHYPTRVTIEDGKHLEEPPSIEGYVHGFKRKTQARVQYYLSTHDGYLFAIQVEKVLTPPTPTDIKSFAKSEEEFREDEHARLRTQIMNSRWFWDLRNVLLVRRAVYPVPQVRDASIQAAQHATVEPINPDQDRNVAPVTGGLQDEEPEFRRSDSDVDDEGGDAGLSKAADKGRLKMHRSFELVLKNGRILRFETYSTKAAVKWVAHLRALVQYWTKRYREDIVTEMNIKESLGEERITVSKRHYKNGHWPPVSAAPDTESASLFMDEFWHWCVLEGCRQIVKSGRIYMKKKFRAQYRHAYLILTRGCLIQFKIKNDFSPHNDQTGRINLLDAYVCSGYYTALALIGEEYDPNAPPVAKYFADGLETRDLTEDTLFMLWYRPHGDSPKDAGDVNRTPIPAMNSKRKVVIFRARSKLERDAWCWALNCEIEQLVRRTRERETRIREQGMPV